ncbi:MAG: aminodeoxychorismate/anthranilate synthase component II [Pseudobacteriovorax sp.]|nr:aminodeoxychorismate/anthranilate synthase component II [Pseudobacteriovorax sp.]
MILLIDNYDSFTYNVYQYLTDLGARVKVVRNDKTTIAKIAKQRPEAIVISPGPGCPDEAGISLDIVKEFSGVIPILGICLGHQTIGQAFGGKVVRAKKLMHGKVSEITHRKRGLFKGLQHPLVVTRYHSLIVDRDSLPSSLKITAETEDGTIMGLRHSRHFVEGIQFHPESYMTESGLNMFENFLGRL